MSPIDITKFKTLPQKVQDAMLSNESARVNLVIKRRYDLSADEFHQVLDSIVKVFFKELDIKDFVGSLKEKLDLDDEIVEKIGLEVLQKRFWPLRDYLGDVETIIKDLGGEIPAETAGVETFKEPELEEKKEEVEEATPSGPSLETGIEEDIKFALEKYKGRLGELFLTKDYIYSKVLNKKVSPTLENWIKDYLSERREEDSSAVARAEYLFKAKNPSSLNKEEKDKLALMLKSYDEGVSLLLVKKDNWLDVSLPEGEGFVEKRKIPAVPLPSPVKEEIKIPELKQEIKIPVKKEELTVKEPLTAYAGFEEEEKEIEELEKKVKVTPPPLKKSLEEIAKEILTKTGQKFPAQGWSALGRKNGDLQKRFSSIILARLRDLRDEIETRAVLLRKKQEGGMEMDETIAEKTVKIIESEVRSRMEEIREIIGKPTEPVKIEKEPEEIEMVEEVVAPPVEEEEFPVPPPVKKEIKEETVKEIPTPLIKKETPAPEAEKKKEIPIQPPPLPVQKIEFEKPVRPAEIPIQPKVKPKPIHTVEPAKPKITDIVRAPKVIGPIEELRILSLENFRRLGANPKEITERIKEKIDILGEESLIKKTEGIKAWRANEVSRLYLEIGQESIKQARTIGEIVSQKSREGKQALTEDEFYAVGDLNKTLRF